MKISILFHLPYFTYCSTIGKEVIVSATEPGTSTLTHTPVQLHDEH